MANVMFQLLKNPRHLAILRKEIDGVVDADEVVVSYDKVRHLPYLRACLDETPEEGWLINGDFIPGGTTVSMSAYAAHRDEKVFPEPEKYMPERWLGEQGKSLQLYFIAFSAGARGCIGRNISYLEQTVLLASVLRRYEFELPHRGWESERRETMNLHLGPLPLRVWRREVNQSLE